jgi:hypothetical protein
VSNVGGDDWIAARDREIAELRSERDALKAERDEARERLSDSAKALMKAVARGDVLWKVLADSQGPDGKVRDYEEALDRFDKELEAFCAEVVASEPERTKMAREEERSGWADEVAGLRAKLDSAISQNDTLREALAIALEVSPARPALFARHGPLNHNSYCRECEFLRIAEAALSLPISPGVELLRAARRYFAAFLRCRDQALTREQRDAANIEYREAEYAALAAWRKDKEQGK